MIFQTDRLIVVVVSPFSCLTPYLWSICVTLKMNVKNWFQKSPQFSSPPGLIPLLNPCPYSSSSSVHLSAYYYDQSTVCKLDKWWWWLSTHYLRFESNQNQMWRNNNHVHFWLAHRNQSKLTVQNWNPPKSCCRPRRAQCKWRRKEPPNAMPYL